MLPVPDSASFVSALGLSLIHFLWQGAAIAVALRLVLALSRSPRARYFWSLAALAAMAAAPAATFWALASGSAEPRAVAIAPLVAPAPGPAWTWMVVAAWAAGASMLGVRAVTGFLLVERLRRRATPLPQAWADRCRALALRAAAPLRVAFAQSQDIAGPIVAGVLRPVVLIPTAALAKMPVAQLEALILHELAHVRRFDALANLFQTVVEILLFYHPATWWVSRTMRIEREHCCDDMAVTEVGDPALYVRALQSLAQLPPLPSAALAASGAPLVERVRRLLVAEVPVRKFDMRALAAALVAATALTFGWSAHVEAKTGAKPAAADVARQVPVASQVADPTDTPGDEVRPPDGAAANRAGEPRDSGADAARHRYEDALSRYQEARARYDAALARYRESTAQSSGDGGAEEAGAFNQQLGDANQRLGAANVALGAAGRRLSSRPVYSEPGWAGPRIGSGMTATINSEHGVTTVDTRGPTLSVSGSGSNVLFLLDGRRSSPAELTAVPPGRVVRIDAIDAGSARARSEGARPDQSVVSVFTKPPPD